MRKISLSCSLKTISLCLGLMLIGLHSNAQTQADTVYTWIDTIKVCPCQSPPQDIIVPVKVKNFDSINSVSIAIKYKNTALQYTGYLNLNPALQFPIVNATPIGNSNLIRIESFCTTGFMAIPDSGTMLELKFKVLCDTTVIVFDTVIDTINNIYTLYSGPNYHLFKSSAVIPGFAINNQPSSTTVYNYQPAQFNCSTTLAVGNPTYQWQIKPDSVSQWSDLTNSTLYNNVNTSTLLIPNPDLGFNGYSFRCKVGGCITYEYSYAAVLTVIDTLTSTASTIEGIVVYDNPLQTPIYNAQVNLKQNNVSIFNVFTDSTGHYSFTNLPAGLYELEAQPTTTWGGVNASDGLKILKHFTGLSLLTGLPLLAADVDNNNSINSIDALMCVERFVGMINSFPAGDWVTEKPTVSINGINTVNQDIKIMCTGDIDRSYIP